MIDEFTVAIIGAVTVALGAASLGVYYNLQEHENILRADSCEEIVTIVSSGDSLTERLLICQQEEPNE